MVRVGSGGVGLGGQGGCERSYKKICKNSKKKYEGGVLGRGVWGGGGGVGSEVGVGEVGVAKFGVGG